MSGFEMVSAFQLGLLDRDASLPIYYGESNAGECSVHGLSHQRAEHEMASFRRASTELASQGVDRIGILKLDTEGSELLVLNDLDPGLDKVDFIHVEYHRDDDRRAIEKLLAGRVR